MLLQVKCFSPISIEIGPADYSMDPSIIEAEIDTRILEAVVVHHQFGFPADTYAISAVGRKHNLIAIEDAACSLGSICGGKQTGGFGDTVRLSFHENCYSRASGLVLQRR